jgi:hypothetical protein
MSMTRERRRDRLRRLAELPDAQVRIRWDRIGGLLLGVVLLGLTMAEFAWAVSMFLDRL